MILRAILVALSLFLFSNILIGQSIDKIKSMEASLDTLSGISLVKMHSRISFAYVFQDIQKGYEWSFRSVQLAEESGDLLAKSTAYRVLGIVYDVDSKSDSAYYYFNKSLNFAKALGSQQEIAMNINNLGMYFWNKGQLDNAANNFIDALMIQENLEDKTNSDGISVQYNNVCLIYNELGQFAKAIPFCEKGLRLNRAAKDTMEMLNNILNLSVAHRNLDDLDKSTAFCEEGILLSKDKSYLSSQASIRDGLARNYLLKRKFKQARTEVLMAIDIAKKDFNKLYKYLATAAEIENELGHFRKAKSYAKQGLKIVDSLEISGNSSGLLKALTRANYGLGDIEQGNRSLDLWSEEKDKTFSNANAEILAAKEIEYNTAQNEKQILEQEIKIERQTNTNRILGLGILAGLLLFFISFVWWRGKVKRTNLVKIQGIENRAKTNQFFALLEGEERERNRLARDLHDGLGQVLSTARMNVSALEDVQFKSEEKNIWKNSVQLIDRAVNEMRAVSHDLTSVALKENNLTQALVELSIQLNESRNDFFVVENSEVPLALNLHQEKIIFRIIQELINNAIKHAKETQLTLSIKSEQEYQLFSLHQNKGKVTLETLEQGTGIGWKNIKSRIALLNGSISVIPNDVGSTFSFRIPKNIS